MKKKIFGLVVLCVILIFARSFFQYIKYNSKSLQANIIWNWQTSLRQNSDFLKRVETNTDFLKAHEDWLEFYYTWITGYAVSFEYIVPPIDDENSRKIFYEIKLGEKLIAADEAEVDLRDKNPSLSITKKVKQFGKYDLWVSFSSEDEKKKVLSEEASEVFGMAKNRAITEDFIQKKMRYNVVELNSAEKKIKKIKKAVNKVCNAQKSSKNCDL